MTTTPIHNLTDVWADGATTFNAIKMNVTDTASADTSKLFLLQVGGTDVVAIDKSGAFQDSLFALADNTDRTKKVQFQVSGVSASTTRTLTVPNFDGTIATLAGTETFTNKTIDSANNTLTLDLSEGTLTGTLAEFNTALSDENFVSIGGAETLTNKTLTSPTISGTLTESAGLAVTSSGAVVETMTVDALVPVYNTAGRRRVLTDNTVNGAYGYRNTMHKPVKTGTRNSIHEAWITFYSDQPSPGADHWDHWNLFLSPLAHDSGLTGAPTGEQKFRGVNAEWNPCNRLSDSGYAAERRLSTNWMGGCQFVPETQDFTGLLGGERVGYSVLFANVIANSPFTNTQNDRHAMTYNGLLIEPNAIGASGRGVSAAGHQSFVTAVAIASGGTGYTEDDVGGVLLIEGPGSSAQDLDATAEILAVSGGAVTSVRLLRAGYYTTPPSNPVTPTGSITVTAGNGEQTVQSLDGTGLTLSLTYSDEADYPHAPFEAIKTWHTGIDFSDATFVDSVMGDNQAARFNDGQSLAWLNQAGTEYRKIIGSASDLAYVSAANNTLGVYIGTANFGSVVANFDTAASTITAYPKFRADDGFCVISPAGAATNPSIIIEPKGAGSVVVATGRTTSARRTVCSLNSSYQEFITFRGDADLLRSVRYGGANIAFATGSSAGSATTDRWHIDESGGLYSEGVTGSGQGAGSINISDEYFIDGEAVIDNLRLHRDRSYTVATLPAAGTAGRNAFASDGRKPGEGGGSGTGVKVFDDGTAWRSVCDGATVAA